MNILKRFFRVSSFSILLALIGSGFYACSSVPKLSIEDRQIISDVLKSPIPEVVKGKTGFAISQSYRIWFESITPQTGSKGAVILIMGNGNDALTWPPTFISNLIDSGYQVIRFDHRETGLSTSEEKWKKKNAYSLNDMAGDVISILDTLEIDKAHIVGASMGGMIAQLVAIEFPERTTSLTSIMSSGDVMDPTLPQMSNDIVGPMIGSILKHGFLGSTKGQIKRQLVQKRILMGQATGEIDTKPIAEIALFNLKQREGYNLLSARHHYQAILNANSRLVQLSQIKIPTLLIHGIKDPVIPFIHSEKLSKIIPNSEMILIENMGHDLPEGAVEEISAGMILNFERSIQKN